MDNVGGISWGCTDEKLSTVLAPDTGSKTQRAELFVGPRGALRVAERKNLSYHHIPYACPVMAVL